MLKTVSANDQLEAFILRIGLVASAARLWGTIGALYNAEMIAIILPLGSGLLEAVFSFVLIVAACRRTLPRWSTWLIPVALSLVFANTLAEAAAIQYRNGSPTLSDIYLFNNYAAT